jgi:Kelch motif
MDAWKATHVSGASPLPRSGHTATFHLGKVYVFGGTDAKGELCSNTITVLATGMFLKKQKKLNALE